MNATARARDGRFTREGAPELALLGGEDGWVVFDRRAGRFLPGRFAGYAKAREHARAYTLGALPILRYP